MFCFNLACMLILAVTSVAVAQERDTIGLGDLMLNWDRLKMRGEQHYTYRAKSPGGIADAGSGKVVFATDVKDKELVLKDKMELTYRGKKLSLDLIHYCQRDNYLSPSKILSKGEGDDEVATFVAVIEGGKAKVEFDGRERIIEIPDDTVSFSALVRILPLLPRDKGLRIEFPHWLESSELNLKDDFMIECLGQDALTRDDQELVCTKFRLTGMGIMPMDAWVDSDGVLQRMLIDKRKVMDLATDDMDDPKEP